MSVSCATAGIAAVTAFGLIIESGDPGSTHDK